MSTERNFIETLQTKEYTVEIDNRKYTIKKLKFGAQARLAGLIASAMEGMKMQLDLENKQNKKETKKINLDISAIIAKAPQLIPEIVAIGLGIELSEVENFENTQQVVNAFVKILEVNPVNDILKKALVLLDNISI